MAYYVMVDALYDVLNEVGENVANARVYQLGNVYIYEDNVDGYSVIGKDEFDTLNTMEYNQ